MGFHIYIALYEVHSPVVFTGQIVGATKTGYVFATPVYLHNYPLMYAFMERPSEAFYVESAKHLKGKTVEYSSVKAWIAAMKRGEPGGWIYAYPPAPLRVSTTYIHTTMLADQHYLDVRGKPKTYAPRNQNYVALAPGTTYCGLVLSPEPLKGPRGRLGGVLRYLSIGVKRLGILKAELFEADVVERLEARMAVSTVPVNEGDARELGFTWLTYRLLWEHKPGGPHRRISLAVGPGMSVVAPRDASARRRLAQRRLPCTRMIAPIPSR